MLSPSSGSTVIKSKLIGRRMFLLTAAKAIVTFGIIGRLVSLQINERTKYKTLSDKNRFREWKLAPERGVIRDFFDKEIASNQQVYQVHLIPENSKDIEKSIVASTDPNMFKDFNAINNTLFRKFYFMRWGTDVFGYLRCAEGKINAVIERDIKIWDVAALEPIIKLAGGFLSTWDGKEIGTNDTVLASGNHYLHRFLLNKLQKFI